MIRRTSCVADMWFISGIRMSFSKTTFELLFSIQISCQPSQRLRSTLSCPLRYRNCYLRDFFGFDSRSLYKPIIERLGCGSWSCKRHVWWFHYLAVRRRVSLGHMYRIWFTISYRWVISTVLSTTGTCFLSVTCLSKVTPSPLMHLLCARPITWQCICE